MTEKVLSKIKSNNKKAVSPKSLKWNATDILQKMRGTNQSSYYKRKTINAEWNAVKRFFLFGATRS